MASTKLYILLFSIFFQTGYTNTQDLHPDGSPFDVVITGGRVLDPETGLDQILNIGIHRGTITAISESSLEAGAKIDAENLVVSPGFIDLDTYARLARFQVLDGVTSMFDIRRGTADVDDWYDQWKGQMPINYGVGVGFRRIRHQVMSPSPVYSQDSAATDQELQEMMANLEEQLARGAIGVGMGEGAHSYLFQEALETFRMAKKHNAHITAPIRDAIWTESDVPAYLGEIIGAASITGASVHIPYLSSSGGPHTPVLLQIIAQAQAAGMDITTEDYPFRGSVNRLDYVADELREISPEELNDVFLTTTGKGMTLEDIDRYVDEKPTIVFLNSWIEPYVEASIISPLVSIASHGFLDDQLRGHPRTSGTYSKVLGHYVRELGSLTLGEALRKMTLMPAQRLEQRVPAMRRKGRIQIGADADLVLFDPDRVIHKATYQEPTIPPEGIEYVIVNGVIVVENGELKEGVFPGLPIRAPVERSGIGK